MLSLQKAVAKMETIKMLTVRQTKMKEIEEKSLQTLWNTGFANCFEMIMINDVSQQNKAPELTLGAQSHRGPWEGHGKHIHTLPARGLPGINQGG